MVSQRDNPTPHAKKRWGWTRIQIRKILHYSYRIHRFEKAVNIRIRIVTLYRMRMQTFVISLPRLQKSRVFVYHTATRDSYVHFLCPTTARSRLSKCPILSPSLRTWAVMVIHQLICLHGPSVFRGLTITSLMLAATKRHLQSIVLLRDLIESRPRPVPRVMLSRGAYKSRAPR